jgi:hypothetical protein
MKKEFIPYEQALALKELGFNEPCFATIDQTRGSMMYDTILYQQAYKFLLDQLEFVSITYFNDGSGNLKEIGFNKPIVDFDTRLECLVELINLVKLKK